MSVISSDSDDMEELGGVEEKEVSEEMEDILCEINVLWHEDNIMVNRGDELWHEERGKECVSEVEQQHKLPIKIDRRNRGVDKGNLN
jgi:hypothetical protein